MHERWSGVFCVLTCQSVYHIFKRGVEGESMLMGKNLLLNRYVCSVRVEEVQAVWF